MREYFLEDYVIEQKRSENVSYILKQSDSFFMTGYKVLQSRESRGLVECARLRYNGKIKLVYFSSQYIALPNIIPYLDVIGVKTVLRNLISNILNIKGNGFLKCENLDARPEKIFVDRNTLEVYLIYLPIKTEERENDRNAFENELRMQLIKLLNSMVNLNGAEMKAILFELSNGSASLEYLYQFLKRESGSYPVSREPLQTQAYGDGQGGVQTLILESTDKSHVFEIQQEEYVLGKSAGKVDGLIQGNPAISRTHCKIMKRNQQFFVVDLSSSNGTYVNGRRVDAGEEVLVRTGDRIQIANMEFRVR